MVVKQKMCSEFSDVVLGWYKRRTWHLKKWSFFQIQKETVAAEEVLLSNNLILQKNQIWYNLDRLFLCAL
jgi:hypothetical protein